ncbi:MAG: hypothetical protein BA865_15000 [Desulfobacterales bacterium S5133MH4]|nr:MAG: hypothetical protein BA865_15000 [Desulfobacterales bacterium S5133MH4]
MKLDSTRLIIKYAEGYTGLSTEAGRVPREIRPIIAVDSKLSDTNFPYGHIQNFWGGYIGYDTIKMEIWTWLGMGFQEINLVYGVRESK